MSPTAIARCCVSLCEASALITLLASKNLVLDENGTAVSTDKPYVSVVVCIVGSLSTSNPFTCRAVRRKRRDEGDDDDEEEEEEEEEESEESEEESAPATSAAPQQELTRAERRQLKKQKGQAATQNGDEDEDEDPILANPNITVGKRMNISDLNAPRELTRKERYVCILRLIAISHFQGSTREEKEKKEAKERYWKASSSMKYCSAA